MPPNASTNSRTRPVAGAEVPTLASVTEPGATSGIWAPEQRRLTGGLVLAITLVAFESLAIATVMPTVKDDLGGLALYGWVFSGFFLASLVGIVAAGQVVDRQGPAVAVGVGLVLFSAGLVVGGSATSMMMLVAGRILQGLGAGTIAPTAFAAIGRGYPARLRPQMFAIISTAWVLPALVGPVIATFVEHVWSWRWVFLGLLPLVAIAAAIAIPSLVTLERAKGRGNAAEPPPRDRLRPGSGRIQLGRTLVLVAGVGAVFVAIDDQPFVLAIVLLALGAPAAAWALTGLLPPGTLRLRAGVPATVGVRGLLACGFFAADAYVPLAVVDGRGAATWVGGLALSAASVTWAGGAWVSARLLDAMGPRRLDRAGFACVIVGLAGMVAVGRGAPVALAVLAWTVAGLGMGLGYAPLAVTVLAAAPGGEEGDAASALQLSDALGVAVGAGIGGWVIATGDQRGTTVAAATTVVFLIALVIGLGGLLAAGRLPAEVPTAPAGEPS